MTEGRASGPGRLIIAVYAVFAVGATSRAIYQIATQFEQARLAYLLSAFAGVVYVIATVALGTSGVRWFWVSVVAIGTELVGVLTIGAPTLLHPGASPDDTFWSGFGRGYLYIPLVLPVLGLWWLHRNRPGQQVP